MKIQWLGHSAFRLIESTGTTIITDPFDPAEVGYGMAYLTADAVTVSGDSPDRKNIKGVKGQPLIVDSEGSFEVSGVHINSVISDNEAENPDGVSNIIFKYRIDGVDICHLGSIDEDCSPGLVEQLMPVNILLLPVGGDGALDAERAYEYVDRLMPDIVIPMRFKTKDCDMDLDKLDNFSKLFDDEYIHEIKDASFEFERDDFSGRHTELYILRRFKG